MKTELKNMQNAQEVLLSILGDRESEFTILNAVILGKTPKDSVRLNIDFASIWHNYVSFSIFYNFSLEMKVLIPYNEPNLDDVPIIIICQCRNIIPSVFKLDLPYDFSKFNEIFETILETVSTNDSSKSKFNERNIQKGENISRTSDYTK